MSQEATAKSNEILYKNENITIRSMLCKNVPTLLISQSPIKTDDGFRLRKPVDGFGFQGAEEVRKIAKLLNDWADKQEK